MNRISRKLGTFTILVSGFYIVLNAFTQVIIGSDNGAILDIKQVEHIGLKVYNTTDNSDDNFLTEGVYAWGKYAGGSNLTLDAFNGLTIIDGKVAFDGDLTQATSLTKKTDADEEYVFTITPSVLPQQENVQDNDIKAICTVDSNG